MRKSTRLRLVGITAGVMLAALGTLNSGVATRRARAFSVFTVTNTNDSGPGSLRDAVNNANNGDTIVFNLALPATISLTTGQIFIEVNVTITGPGANLLTISGSHLSRAFQFAPANITISGLTIANCTDAVDGQGGGGVFVGGGTVTFSNCIFSNNKALGDGAAIINSGGALIVNNCAFNLNSANGAGGGIANSTGDPATLSVTGCTFTNNFADLGGGGIVNNGVTLAVTGCTFTLNSTDNAGGGIANFAGAMFSATNCTFSNDSALGGGAIEAESTGAASIANCTISANSGGGIFVLGGTFDLQNTIIADSTGKPDCTSAVILALNSHNLIKDGSCSPMLSGSPMLGSLQNNGGPTSTMALLPGSPAIDAGDDSVLGSPFSLTTDQRGPGFPRRSGLHVDIGAYELQQAGPPLPSFDTCLKDKTTGNLLQWNSTTGQYQFTRCSDSFTLTGTGVAKLVNGIRTLTDFKTDRRISAGFNTGQLTGNGTIYLMVAQGVWQTFRIIDTNPSAVCKC